MGIPINITDKMKSLFHEEGYMIFENVIPEDILSMLRQECSYFVGYRDGQMDEKGVDVEGITHRGKRYFIANLYRKSPYLWRFIFSPLMAEIARAALGDNVFLFNEQWVVKGPVQGMKFAWHQDSGYVKHRDNRTEHKPYLTCWCTLDDVSKENGTIYVLPHSKGGTKNTVFDHNREENTNDLVGYQGDDPGIVIEVPAGSIVSFSSYNLHRSGPNSTPNMRRVYLAQYSSEPIMSTLGRRWAQAVPFIRDGAVVYEKETDNEEQYGMPGKFEDL